MVPGSDSQPAKMSSFESEKKRLSFHFKSQSSSEKKRSSEKKYEEVFPENWTEAQAQNPNQPYAHAVEPDWVIHEVS